MSVLIKSIIPSSIIFVLFLTCTMYMTKYTKYNMSHLNMPVISLRKTTIGKEWLYHTAFTQKTLVHVLNNEWMKNVSLYYVFVTSYI